MHDKQTRINELLDQIAEHDDRLGGARPESEWSATYAYLKILLRELTKE